MSRHPLSTQDPPTESGLYWVRLTPYDDGEALRWDGEAFRAGATVRPWYEWRERRPGEGFARGNWAPRYEGKQRGT